jgi:hypothetical protein
MKLKRVKKITHGSDLTFIYEKAKSENLTEWLFIEQQSYLARLC